MTLPASDVARKILEKRGITSEGDCYDFFYQDLYGLSNPFAINGVHAFITRINEAVDAKEHILVYGDKDADGVCAAALLFSTLSKALPEQVHAYVPTHETGYGLNRDVVEEYARGGVSLVITCDCGISNVDEIEYFREIGVDVIVTDHHDVPETLPNAYAIYNPKIEGSGFPDREICGCAVAFKLLQAYALSRAGYYGHDFIILDFAHTDHSYALLKFVKAIRVRDFGAQEDGVFGYELSANGTYRAMYASEEDFELSITDVLEEFGSFCFENEQTHLTLTGGSARLAQLFRTFEKYELEIPPYQDVFDLTALATKTMGMQREELRSLESFARAAGVNPYRNPDAPFRDLLLRAEAFIRMLLRSRTKCIAYFERSLALVALATVADVMPLQKENRVFVKEGIKSAGAGTHFGINTLLEKTGVKLNEITATTIAWKLAPFINAAGRMGKPEEALALLSAENAETARAAAETIHALNEQRKRLADENAIFVNECILKECNVETDKVFVVKSDAIEQGLTGLIAGKMVSRYKRPVVVVYENKETGECVGSARSGGNDNVRKMVEASKETLIKFGGHMNASGFSLLSERFDAFKARCIAEANALGFGNAEVERAYDLRLSFKHIDLDLAMELEAFEPFGQKNEEPLFATTGVEVVNTRVIGKNANHLMLELQEGGRMRSAVIWNVKDQDVEDIRKAKTMNITYALRVNRFNGTVEPRLYIERYTLS